MQVLMIEMVECLTCGTFHVPWENCCDLLPEAGKGVNIETNTVLNPVTYVTEEGTLIKAENAIEADLIAEGLGEEVTSEVLPAPLVGELN